MKLTPCIIDGVLFNSVTEAAEITGVKRTTISSAILRAQSSGGVAALRGHKLELPGESALIVKFDEDGDASINDAVIVKSDKVDVFAKSLQFGEDFILN